MNELIALLKQNARLSDAQLAVMLGKTEAEVAAEIKQLEQDGVIKGYSVICNEELTNDDRVNAIIELRVTPQKDCGFEEIAHTIMQYDEVESISLVSISGDNVKDVALFVSQRLAPLHGVLSTATHFVLKKYKEKGIFIETEEPDERGFVGP